MKSIRQQLQNKKDAALKAAVVALQQGDIPEVNRCIDDAMRADEAMKNIGKPQLHFTEVLPSSWGRR